MSTRLHRATVLTACAIALAACGDPLTPIPGQPEATTPQPTGQPTAAPTEDSRFGAPSVDEPLDASKQLADPCTSLSPDQLRTLDMKTTPRPGDKDSFNSLGPYCSWRDSTNRENYTVGYNVPNKNGLADLYRAQENGNWAYWEPTTVNGYPAVWKELTDLRDMGGCNISVGITDQLHFSVFVARAVPATACEDVKKVAGAVVETLKKNGG
ncbi:DUF3558 domain-containing protein [Actinokineospora sp. 24-640]